MPLLVAVALAISGEVVTVDAHWTDDGRQIITEATVRTPTGDVTVSQLGGTADGLTMRVFDDIPLLRPGMIVDLTAREGVDLLQRAHTDVESVRVVYDPEADSEGFVRTGPTDHGHYLFWESGCIFLTPDADGTAAIPGDGEFAVIDASIATWNDGTNTPACSYIRVVENPPVKAEVGKDYKNVLKFRDDKWCRPANNAAMEHCYNPAAAGITTATYITDGSSRDGAIVDADIEINGAGFAISVNGQSTSGISCKAELQNTLTHELGHLHGLEHTCLASGDPARTDGAGNPVPACGPSDPPAILSAVMYPFQDCGETKKEALTADDSTAICTIYPVSKDPKTCSAPVAGGGCCDAGGDPGGSLALAGALGLILRVRSALA